MRVLVFGRTGQLARALAPLVRPTQPIWGGPEATDLRDPEACAAGDARRVARMR